MRETCAREEAEGEARHHRKLAVRTEDNELKRRIWLGTVRTPAQTSGNMYMYMYVDRGSERQRERAHTYMMSAQMSAFCAVRRLANIRRLCTHDTSRKRAQCGHSSGVEDSRSALRSVRTAHTSAMHAAGARAEHRRRSSSAVATTATSRVRLCLKVVIWQV